jgi:phage terminase small subunit
MNSAAPPIPLPKEPRHQRFADLVLRGRPLVDAYLESGFKCSRATANANAKKLRKRPDVEAYIRAIQTTVADDTTLSVQEILQYCARVVRIPITKLDPRDPEGKNSDLIKSFTINDTETGSSFRLEKHDPFKAIDTHLKLSGHDPESNALNELAHVLANLTNTPLPDDKM